MSGSRDASEPRPASRPELTPPAGACDCHTHVFGPFDRFPVVGGTSYLPPLAPREVHLAMLEAVGMDRAVLIQPTAYRLDPAPMLQALRASPGRLRGTAVATSETDEATLAEMDAAGVRGLRFIEMPDPKGDGRYAGGIGTDELERLAPRMKELGWHAEIWAPCAFFADSGDRLNRLGIPWVMDHMGSLKVENGTADPHFQRLVGQIAGGNAWLKLSPCRISRDFPDYRDVRRCHDALLDANPDRLVWGSDWPHVRMGDRTPDVGHLMDIFCDWIGDEALIRKILVANPAELYGFGA